MTLGWDVTPRSVLHPAVAGDDHTGLLAVHSLSKQSTAAGYRTGFIGKYLNQYQPTHPIGTFSQFLKGAYVPPGWETWNGADGAAYWGYNYSMAVGHDVHFYGRAPKDYLTSVAQQRGVSFIKDASARRTPWTLRGASVQLSSTVRCGKRL